MEQLTIKQQLEKSFSDMDMEFSSNEFLARLRQYGCPEKFIHHNKHIAFLNRNAYKSTISKRYWCKTEAKAVSQAINKQIIHKHEVALDEKTAIQFLKNKGYKIFKIETTEV